MVPAVISSIVSVKISPAEVEPYVKKGRVMVVCPVVIWSVVIRRSLVIIDVDVVGSAYHDDGGVFDILVSDYSRVLIWLTANCLCVSCVYL